MSIVDPKQPVEIRGSNVGIHTSRLLEVGDSDSAELEKKAGVSLGWCPRNRQQAKVSLTPLLQLLLEIAD